MIYFTLFCFVYIVSAFVYFRTSLCTPSEKRILIITLSTQFLVFLGMFIALKGVA